MSQTIEAEKVMRSMGPLFAKAEQLGLWFYSPYQSLWFSPQRLRDQQAQGRFMWGAVNWELRDPKEHAAKLRQKAKDANREAEAFEAELRG